jgi:hypothetical protein
LEKEADGGAGMKSPFWFSSLLEFRLWYFPTLSDRLVTDYLGLEDWEYGLLLIQRDLRREFEYAAGASDSLQGLSVGMTATAAAMVLDLEMAEMAKPNCVKREAGYYEP